MKKYVLIAIKPKFAELIKQGKKTVELRRVAPKVSKGDILVIYESSPICKITSYAEILEVVSFDLEKLWGIVGPDAMVSRSDFNTYFGGKQQGNGIRIKKLRVLSEPYSLDILSDVCVPQNYRYLTKKQFESFVKRSAHKSN